MSTSVSTTAPPDAPGIQMGQVTSAAPGREPEGSPVAAPVVEAGLAGAAADAAAAAAAVEPGRFEVEVHARWTPALRAEVVEFLRSLPVSAGVCIEHDPRWLDVLSEAMGHRPRMLLARDPGGRVLGYLPLGWVNTLFNRLYFGGFLVSLPYLNRGGAVAVHPAVTHRLIDRAVGLAEELGVRYLELRHGERITHAALGGARDDKVRMVMELPGLEVDMMEFHKAKVRAQVRKGDRFNFSVHFGSDELLDDFHEVFSINMRDLGTPVYSRGLFGAVLKHFPDQAELAVVRHEGRPVSCALLLHDVGEGRVCGLETPSCTQVPSASCLREANEMNANMWMYHQLLVRAQARGSREFDFGRSSVESGTWRFKKQWGALERPTVWQYHLRRGDMNAMRPDNPGNQRKVEMWKKLPLWLTRVAGPVIVKAIP
jgi:FemAB-related protein (PEP-CTERM system-associated)